MMGKKALNETEVCQNFITPAIVGAVVGGSNPLAPTNRDVEVLAAFPTPERAAIPRPSGDPTSAGSGAWVGRIAAPDRAFR
jgi:hypothetical protein